jgi:ribulose-5-phosphate 4-epimerase/fuculose-1-phosphate aldolase
MLSFAIAASCALGLAVTESAQPLPPPSAGGPDPKLVEDLAYANRILYDQGVLDGFGHISVRHDKDSSRFLLSRNMAPPLVTPADIMEHDLQGQPVNAGNRRPYLERFIHAGIYRARPDVISVVHSHSASVIPLGATATNLRPISHMAGFLGAGTPIFEIREFGGITDMLVRDNSLADGLAKVLGNHAVALMRGHGSVVVADSIQLAVWRAVYTEMNARLQSDATRLGPINFLTPEEGAKAAATNEGQTMRSWDLWKARIGSLDKPTI